MGETFTSHISLWYSNISKTVNWSECYALTRDASEQEYECKSRCRWRCSVRSVFVSSWAEFVKFSKLFLWEWAIGMQMYLWSFKIFSNFIKMFCLTLFIANTQSQELWYMEPTLAFMVDTHLMFLPSSLKVAETQEEWIIPGFLHTCKQSFKYAYKIVQEKGWKFPIVFCFSWRDSVALNSTIIFQEKQTHFKSKLVLMFWTA